WRQSRRRDLPERRQRCREPGVLGVDPGCELFGAVEVAAPRPLFQLEADLREARGAEGLTVRLERVGRAAHLSPVTALERGFEGSEERGRVGEEGGHDLGEEVVTAELAQAFQRARLERSARRVASADLAHTAERLRQLLGANRLRDV